MTTFMNLMVVLLPFLLLTAVFSQTAIIELSLPSAAGGTAAIDPVFRLEVIVRADSIEIGDGRQVFASIPKRDDAYDLRSLNDQVVILKRQNPDTVSASVLLEPQIEYDHLIQVMDAVRATHVASTRPGELQQIALFTDISIGDAP